MRETAPNLELCAETRFAANDSQEVARATSVQCRDKLWQQASGKRFIAGLELDVSFDSRTLGSGLWDFKPASLSSLPHCS